MFPARVLNDTIVYRTVILFLPWQQSLDLYLTIRKYHGQEWWDQRKHNHFRLVWNPISLRDWWYRGRHITQFWEIRMKMNEMGFLVMFLTLTKRNKQEHDVYSCLLTYEDLISIAASTMTITKKKREIKTGKALCPRWTLWS